MLLHVLLQIDLAMWQQFLFKSVTHYSEFSPWATSPTPILMIDLGLHWSKTAPRARFYFTHSGPGLGIRSRLVSLYFAKWPVNGMVLATLTPLLSQSSHSKYAFYRLMTLISHLTPFDFCHICFWHSCTGSYASVWEVSNLCSKGVQRS